MSLVGVLESRHQRSGTRADGGTVSLCTPVLSVKVVVIRMASLTDWEVESGGAGGKRGGVMSGTDPGSGGGWGSDLDSLTGRG